MIESVTFKNFKALRDTTLPLGPFTLLIGPNGSGKSTALKALNGMKSPKDFRFADLITADLRKSGPGSIDVLIHWGGAMSSSRTVVQWAVAGVVAQQYLVGSVVASGPELARMRTELDALELYALDAKAIAQPVTLTPKMEMAPNGSGLAGVLDGLRDGHPERFEQLNQELGRWLPEFDRILFETPGTGQRAIMLRTRKGHYKIKATDISQGTLLALAIFTLAYLPDPPPIVCLEEPDRGIHPRLLRHVRDAIYRLAYPESAGEDRKPVQVIATTHSPYMLDLFKDHPEEIVIAQKVEGNVTFERLSDRGDLEEILQGAHLGDAWYSGVLGGVPTDR